MPRPALVRYTGLAGSLWLAAAAWTGGVTDPWRPTVTPREGWPALLCWLAGTELPILARRSGVPPERAAWLFLARDLRWLIALVTVAAVLCLPDGYNLALATKTQGSAAVTALAVIWTLAGIRRSLTGHRNDKIIA